MERDEADARQQFAATQEILLAMARTGADPDTVLDAINERAIALCGAQVALVYLLDEGAFRAARVTGAAPEPFLDYVERNPFRVSRESLVGRVVLDRRTQQIPDVLADPEYGRQDLQRMAGFRTVLAAPLLLDNEVVGVLCLWRLHVDPFGERETAVLETFAVQAAVVARMVTLVRALEEKSVQLEIASRHKSDFLASMSHELRTPLNAVIGFSEVLLDRLFGDINDRQEEYLRDIWNSGHHLLELLNDILDLSKVEAGQMTLEPQAFDVAPALDYALSLVRERAVAHGIGLHLDVSPDVTVVETDDLRFRQVVVNLVSNAVKFTPDGGDVTVSASVSDGVLVVAVADTGVGIPTDERERIFESFQQGRRGIAKTEGTGLGLALSRRIVELLGGRLWLDSEVGVGSVFRFAVPLPVPRRVPGARPASAERTILLLVEDDRASLDLLTAYLSQEPVDLLTVTDGAEGLDLVHRVRPAAVVLDIRLPGVDGWTVLERLAADPVTADIPVVVVTVDDDRARGLALGAREYLIKPVRRDDLVAALREVGALPSSEVPA